MPDRLLPLALTLLSLAGCDAASLSPPTRDLEFHDGDGDAEFGCRRIADDIEICEKREG